VKPWKRFGTATLIIFVLYGLISVLHPMPFLYKLDVQYVEVTDKSGDIMYKTEDPTKVDAFYQLFKYNTPYMPWQQNSWGKITPAAKKLPPDIIINFNNDLGETRYSFASHLSDPTFVEIRQGFFMPWSISFYPLNPAIAGWRTIAGK
jgi:hypothetical protein